MTPEAVDPGAEVVALAWSTGKDSALALEVLRSAGRPPACLLTTTVADRVPMHEAALAVAAAQAAAVGLPLVVVPLPEPYDHDAYLASIEQHLAGAPVAPTEVAFGDLFLADLRARRERDLAATGRRATFPVWGGDTATTARRVLDAGIRAVVVSVDTDLAPAELLGRPYDLGLVAELEAAGADPCGEHGEIHTVVTEAPAFGHALRLTVREARTEGRYHHLLVDVDD